MRFCITNVLHKQITDVISTCCIQMFMMLSGCFEREREREGEREREFFTNILFTCKLNEDQSNISADTSIFLCTFCKTFRHIIRTFIKLL